ncbi:MAG TPA: PAS domain S-box protein, partial [Longimicrobiaceae bacterium]|nr:PAS domain S-box protein [Longimicrobiaceae bacterium]
MIPGYPPLLSPFRLRMSRSHDSPPLPSRGSDALYRLLVENVTDYAIFMFDPGGRVTSWNEGAERIFGYPEEEVLGRHISLFYLPEEVQAGRPEAELREVVETGRCDAVSWRVRRDGSRLWGTVVLTAVTDEAGRIIGIGQITRDLTERKQVALQYEESRQRYRSLFQYNTSAICSLDLRGRVLGANPAAEALCGLSAEELERGSLRDLLVPEDAERTAEHLRRAAQGEPQTLEVGLLHRSGSRVDASVTVFPIMVDGEILGVYAIAQDISERKRAEVEREVLLLRERIAREEAEAASHAKSGFLAVMSHELKTPLNVITGYADLLYDQEAGPLTPLQHRHLGRIRETSRHLARMIEQILAFARMEAGREEVRPEPLDLAELLRETAAMVEPLAREKGLRFHCDLPPGAWIRDSDPLKARQILLNLLSNALKFTERGEVRLRGTPEPDGTLTLVVSDTGIGIRPEHLERVWEPFWQAEDSLTRRAEGTGLGLGIARHLANLLGWEILLESTLGVGSTFTIRLPP